jgi:translation initiation factor IF-2
MPRKRVHELAKELGMDARYLLARLEDLGVHGKKAQSTLTDQEIALVHPDTAQHEAAQPVVGQERLVAERVVTEVGHEGDHVITAREEVRESRISTQHIRRRATRTVIQEDETLPAEPIEEKAPEVVVEPEAPTPFSSSTETAFEAPMLEPLAGTPEMPLDLPPMLEPTEPALPVAFHEEIPPVLPETPSAPPVAVLEPEAVPAPVVVAPQPQETTTPESPTLRQKVETALPPPPPAVTPPPSRSTFIPSARPESPSRTRSTPTATAVSAAPASTAPAASAPVSSRIIGKIDLSKLKAPPPPEARPRQPEVWVRPPEVRPRPQFPSTPTSAPATREPTAEAGGPPADSTGKRPAKKRKVIRKPETLEVQERDLKLGRGGAKKKRMMLPGKEQRSTEITVPRASKRVIRISEVVTVGDLARNMGVKAGEVIKKLIGLGVMATINQVLDTETATLVASDFDYTVENVAFDVEAALEVGHEVEEGGEQLEERPPVVTIMGHVDHGKTSLLDAIRKTNVTAREHGGITQHIGAYSVPINGRSVTFLDTPGHAAFTAMRARGAQVTDLVVLVVAADDGVMPQTIEAVNHARAAEVPVIVAVNKIDRPDADADRVKRELMNYGLVSEEYGGDTIFAPVSAKTAEGIPHLLEMILLQADVLELRAHPDKLARGAIVEAKLDRGRGPVATVLVQEGILKIGDAVVCGAEYGRVRAMVDSWGERVEKASPSMPVEILGLTGVPEAGDPLVVLGDETKARQVAEHRKAKRRETELTKSSGRTTLEDFYQQAQAGEVKELRVIVKADVQGSVEAVSDSLSRLSTSEVKLTVLHSSTGGISESDVLLASASKGIIIGFNVRAEGKAGQIAEREGVEIRLYNIIYEVIEDVRAALEGLLAPTYKEKPLGRAEVRQVFTVSRLGQVAGCMITEGKVLRGAQARLVRDRAVVHEGRLGSLRRFKDDVREVAAGAECGIGFENFHDVQPGDIIEAYELEQVLRRLETRPQPEAERRAS